MIKMTNLDTDIVKLVNKYFWQLVDTGDAKKALPKNSLSTFVGELEDKRKAEIKRIAERHYIDNGVELSCAIEMAIGFVDKFDFEFDRLEKGE